MEETPVPGHVCSDENCTHDMPETTSEDTSVAGHEEMAFAFLLAIVPLVVLTFFGQVGLI